MLCDICKKADATVHLTQIVEGKILKVDMCEGCSKTKGVQDSAAFSLAELLAGFTPPATEEEKPVEGPGIQCPACGMSQADFKKMGRFGCAQCWTVFEDGLGPLLKAMHKGDRHVGKVPGKAAHTLVINEKIKQLAEQLQKFIRDEQYEEAAAIRDEIRTLETKLKAA
ncbi:MAG: excinuclease ABC subunit B [Verrucomicrobia bacterium]|nr:excinuclease ABC subunit B [Verrucomicrobiota bacterium]